jgi:hypothetical protein
MGKTNVPMVPDLDAQPQQQQPEGESTAALEVAKLSIQDDNDDTEMTEESSIATSTAAAETTTAATTAAPTEKRKQLFPQNSKRNLRQSTGGSSGGSKRNLGKTGGSLRSIARPILKKRNSSKSKQIAAVATGVDSNGNSSSGAEDN